MSNEPQNLQDMIRRALSAQVDLGHTELVLDHRAAADPMTVAQAVTMAPKVVSVGDAIAASENPFDLTEGTDKPMSGFANLHSHREAICDCLRCPLGETRTKFVYGVGNPDADLMFVGEAPGADEDRQGEPFVGRAGKLLDKIIEAMELKRSDVYIANILKCRPPGNRDPQPEEMAKCFKYLREQVRLIKPKFICGLGRIAAQAMLETNQPLGKLRGSWHSFEGVPMLVTYHPAALLRFASYKKDTWADMQMLLARYRGTE